jgi:type II secretory pathway pseudopilin PulG
LIELLVVVAIIALLIAILLPSLSKARAQARMTICGTRIAQLAKAVLIYANDFDGAPPFLGVGFEDLDDLGGTFDGHTRLWWAEQEDWEIPHIPDIYNLPEELWPERARTRFGDLFTYTRFEKIYRCPEFERVQNKMQNHFNYTRSVMARKVLSEVVGDPVDGEMEPGPLMKVESICSPGKLFMLLDEQWDFHVAGRYYEDPEGILDFSDFWMGADSIHGILGDCIGSYHGPKAKSVRVDGVLAGKKGAAAFYDGHVEFVRDPVPGRVVTIDIGSLGDIVDEAEKVLNFVISQIYAQRCIDFGEEEVTALLF